MTEKDRRAPRGRIHSAIKSDRCFPELSLERLRGKAYSRFQAVCASTCHVAAIPIERLAVAGDARTLLRHSRRHHAPPVFPRTAEPSDTAACGWNGRTGCRDRLFTLHGLPLGGGSGCER